eukprot:251132-Prymnesium_polylepis.1
MVDFGFGLPDLNIDPGFTQPGHPRVKLVPSAQGVRAFEISFKAALPYNALDADPPLLHPIEPR